MGPKNANAADFRKNQTSLEESLLQSFFVWKLSAQSCKAFIRLTNRAKMIGGGRPLLPGILSQSDRVGAKFEQ